MSHQIRRSYRNPLAMVFLLALLPVAPAAAGDVQVGGWAGFVVADNDKPGSIPAFDAHPWYMYVAAEPVENWKFLGELEAEHVFQFKAGAEGGGGGEFKLDRLYIERNLDTAHNFRAGKTFLPFGYWYSLHWHFLTETLSRPVSYNNEYTPRHNVGLQFFGTRYFGVNRVDTFIWLGNGPDIYGANERTVDTFGRGASLYYSRQLGDSHRRTIGATAGYHAQSVAVDNTLQENQSNVVAAADLKYDRLELRAENFWHSRGTREDLASWYANVSFWLEPRVALNWRLDRGDDLKGAQDDLNPGSAATSYGVVYRPEARILIKAEYRLNEFDDPGTADYADWNAFLALKY